MRELTDNTAAGLFDSAPIAMITISNDGIIVLVNAEAERLFCYSREELIGIHVGPLVSIADPDLLPYSTELEMEGRRQDGTTFSAAISVAEMSTRSGSLVTATIRDVSKRIEVEAEAESVRLQVEANRVQAEGEKREAERVRLEAEVDRVAAEGEKREAESVRLQVEAVRVKAEGEKREAERVRLRAEAVRVKAESEKTVAEVKRVKAEGEKTLAEGVRVKAEGEKTVAEEVRLEVAADRERLEAQLHQSQRMESLGQLAGGVAHDFNNLLAVILNYASFVAEELSSAVTSSSGMQWEGPLKDVEQIQLAAERASVLTHQLLSFARREVVQARPLSLNGAIIRMSQILRRTIGEQIQLVINLADDLPMVMADPGQIEQIVLNLAINARDAMPMGGTLSIETTLRKVSEDDDLSTQLPAGSFVCCRVSDNGTGMSTEVRDRAFEPFFTTKPRGEGSGLGLATVYGIVSQSGGHTRIYSEEGVGTSITILLPVAARANSSVEPARDHRGNEQLVGTETILVVDDEEALREVTRRILTRNGYTVLTAASGVEARQLAESFANPIHLVLTDVIMPGMQGPTVASEVKKFRPDVRVLFMSGHAQPVLEAEALLGTDFVLVEKPFDQVMLLESVRKVLNRDN